MIDPIVVGPPAGMLGVVGAVVLLAALLSGLVERSRLPQIVIFLALGVALGRLGLGVIDLDLDSPAVRVIATLGLVLVLFMDAVGVSWTALRRYARTAAIILGPGTLVTAGVVGVAAYVLLDLTVAESAILGAALASTDPVLLRGILRSPATPEAARTALRIESGMNDAVLLPIILVAMGLLAGPGAEPVRSGSLVASGFEGLLLGGGAGVVVAVGAVGALHVVRERIGMQHDYESLYALGVALAAYAAAEAVHGSGFIAAFVAGLTIATLDIELCDCFVDYGQATAEMALLFTFVALGGYALWRGLDVADARTLLFAGVALFARGLILLPLIGATGLDARSRRIVVWFGPRGLSSLLLVLLPFFAGVPGSDRLFAVTALVVLCSIVVHGGSQVFLAQPERASAPEPPTDRITLEELDDLRRRGERVVILDARKQDTDPTRAAGAIRVPPDRAVETVSALGLPRDAWLASYCT
ncbi:MAG: cation:proton antiporter [Gemmatimonadales bacterium]